MTGALASVSAMLWLMRSMLPNSLRKKACYASIQPMLNITLAFAFVLRKYPQTAAATHAIARELTANAAPELDAFMSEHGVYAPEIDTCLASGIAALPPAVQQTVLLNVSEGFWHRGGMVPSPAGRGFWHRPQRGDLDQPLSQPQGLSRQVHAPRCGKLAPYVPPDALSGQQEL